MVHALHPEAHWCCTPTCPTRPHHTAGGGRLESISQEALAALRRRHRVRHSYNGLAHDRSEGERIARAMGDTARALPRAPRRDRRTADGGPGLRSTCTTSNAPPNCSSGDVLQPTFATGAAERGNDRRRRSSAARASIGRGCTSMPRARARSARNRIARLTSPSTINLCNARHHMRRGDVWGDPCEVVCEAARSIAPSEGQLHRVVAHTRCIGQKQPGDYLSGPDPQTR